MGSPLHRLSGHHLNPQRRQLFLKLIWFRRNAVQPANQTFLQNALNQTLNHRARVLQREDERESRHFECGDYRGRHHWCCEECFDTKKKNTVPLCAFFCFFSLTRFSLLSNDSTLIRRERITRRSKRGRLVVALWRRLAVVLWTVWRALLEKRVLKDTVFVAEDFRN